jgi:hypothetical protein
MTPLHFILMGIFGSCMLVALPGAVVVAPMPPSASSTEVPTSPETPLPESNLTEGSFKALLDACDFHSVIPCNEKVCMYVSPATDTSAGITINEKGTYLVAHRLVGDFRGDFSTENWSWAINGGTCLEGRPLKEVECQEMMTRVGKVLCGW